MTVVNGAPAGGDTVKAARPRTDPKAWGVWVDETHILTRAPAAARQWWAEFWLHGEAARFTALAAGDTGAEWHVAAKSLIAAVRLRDRMLLHGIPSAAATVRTLTASRTATARRVAARKAAAGPQVPDMADRVQAFLEDAEVTDSDVCGFEVRGDREDPTKAAVTFRPGYLPALPGVLRQTLHGWAELLRAGGFTVKPKYAWAGEEPPGGDPVPLWLHITAHTPLADTKD
jgi:hypothetical protein